MSMPAVDENYKNQHGNKKNKIETPRAIEPDKAESDEQKVHLEFPYDDLELLYEYTLNKMGIKDPFK
jgi:hypothetical protein